MCPFRVAEEFSAVIEAGAVPTNAAPAARFRRTNRRVTNLMFILHALSLHLMIMPKLSCLYGSTFANHTWATDSKHRLSYRTNWKNRRGFSHEVFEPCSFPDVTAVCVLQLPGFWASKRNLEPHLLQSCELQRQDNTNYLAGTNNNDTGAAIPGICSMWVSRPSLG